MRLISAQLPADHNIFFYGDVHTGNPLSSDSNWYKFVDAVNHKYDGCNNNFAIDGGDAIEAITRRDRRFGDEHLKEPKPNEQAKIAVKMREPIKKKLLAMLMGNHEENLLEYGDLTNEMASQLGTNNGTFAMKVTVNDKHGMMYKIFDEHGKKQITSAADDPQRRRTNMELTLKRHLKFKAGDCAVMIKHHVHKLLVTKPISELYLVDNGKEIKQAYTGWGQNEPYIHPDARWFGCAGSFLKLYGDGISGYAEMAEYDPVELGFLVLKVRDRKIIGLEPVYLGV